MVTRPEKKFYPDCKVKTESRGRLGQRESAMADLVSKKTMRVAGCKCESQEREECRQDHTMEALFPTGRQGKVGNG